MSADDHCDVTMADTDSDSDRDSTTDARSNLPVLIIGSGTYRDRSTTPHDVNLITT
jgi:hypothetical protein